MTTYRARSTSQLRNERRKALAKLVAGALEWRREMTKLAASRTE